MPFGKNSPPKSNLGRELTTLVKASPIKLNHQNWSEKRSRAKFWTSLIRRLRWVTHPITIFVFLQVVWLAITLIWVIWFVGQQAEIAELAKRFGHESFSSRGVLAILVVGCILLGVLLLGTILLFVFGQRQSYLARQHRSFVSSVTHELRSPLASLQLSFETMTSRSLKAPVAEKIHQMIESDIGRLRRLVDQILIAGRLDRGVPSFEDEGDTVEVADVIKTATEKLAYLDPALSTRLKIQCPNDLVAYASSSTLGLILSNLLENAIKYSPRTEPIEIKVVRQADPPMVQLTVKDRGLGLEKTEIRRLFKMFHRGELAIKKAIPGTGLGLYIVRAAVQMLGGKITVQSEGHGLGSAFTVCLPAAKPRFVDKAANTGEMDLSFDQTKATLSSTQDPIL